MKRNKILTMILAAVMVLSAAASLSACGSDDRSDDSANDKNTSEATESVTAEGEVEFDGENDDSRDSAEAFDAKLESKANSVTNKDARELNSDAKNFYGSWTATSEKAAMYYGNLDITINKDNTFDANVTGDDYSGSWTKTEYGIHLDGEILNGVMYYGDGCKMVIDEDDMKITLTKK